MTQIHRYKKICFFQKFSWLRFCVYKLCMIMCIILCHRLTTVLYKIIKHFIMKHFFPLLIVVSVEVSFKQMQNFLKSPGKSYSALTGLSKITENTFKSMKPNPSLIQIIHYHAKNKLNLTLLFWAIANSYKSLMSYCNSKHGKVCDWWNRSLLCNKDTCAPLSYTSAPPPAQTHLTMVLSYHYP